MECIVECAAEAVVEAAVKAMAEAVAQAEIERRAAPEIELLSAVTQLPAVTVVPNLATQTQLASVSVDMASVPYSRRRKYDIIGSMASNSMLLQEPGPESGCESHGTRGTAWK